MEGFKQQLEDVGNHLGPLADAFEAVQQEIREKFKKSYEHKGVLESLQEFASAVNWRVSHSAIQPSMQSHLSFG